MEVIDYIDIISDRKITSEQVKQIDIVNIFVIKFIKENKIKIK